MSVPATIYARFSTAEQSKGHSLERQLSAGRAYVQRMGWLHDPEREIADEGRSAFHGVNRAEGSALYAFEEKAREGHFKNGHALAVENIDRLTRQGWEQATDLLRMLTSNGVTVACWQNNEVFQAGERIDMGRVMLLIAKAEVALEESAKKAGRQKDSWDARIRAAQAGEPSTRGMMPSWLQRDAVTLKPEPIPRRAKLLNEIYDRYIEGQSIPKIVHWLNSAGEPTWGRGKQADKIWNVASMHKLLTARTVLGEYQPKERYIAGSKRRNKGAPIADYYPQVISTEKYNRAQAVRKQKTGWGGKTTPTFRNLFTGIARCSECGGKMHMTTLIKAGRVERHVRHNPANGYRTSVRGTSVSYLYCYDHNRGTPCTNGKRIRYQHLEAGVMAMLPRVFERAFARQQASPNELADRCAEFERNLHLKKQSLAVMVENLGQLVSKALVQRAAELEAEIDADEAALEQMRRDVAVELGKPLPKEEVDEVARIYATMNEGSEDEQQTKRQRVNIVLRTLIDAMDCKPDGSTMLVAGGLSLGLTFNPEGQCTDVSVLRARYEGPDGELNWRPDEAAA